MHQSTFFFVRVAAIIALLVSSGCGMDALDLDGNAPEGTSLKGPAAILINIDGSFPQFNIAPELFAPMGQSQYELENVLAKAATDPQVRELIVHIGAPNISFARAGELADALVRFAAAGKPVTCHVDSVDNVTYWMAARACPRILISPAGGVDALGISLEQVFFKDLLDSLGLQADVLSVGKYKDVAEPLTRDGFSEGSREVLQSLLGEIHNVFIGGIASHRKLSTEKVNEIINGGPYGADDAVKHGLADQVISLGTHLELVRSKYEGGVVEDYGKLPPKPLDFQEILKLFGEQGNQEGQSGHPKIALVPAIGEIVSGPSDDVFGGRDMIRDTLLVNVLFDLARDDSVKAVVIRIDSPGGSALASDNIWHAVRALAKKKPVVASMGEVAASGGYYIAAGATEILASPTTITGSIGVIGGKLVIVDGATRIGVKSEQIKFNKLAGLGSPFSPFGEDGRKTLMRVMKQTYDLFVSRVVDGRGLTKEKVHSLAQGRVWTGSQALEHGLVNASGGLHEAIKRATELANIAHGTPVELFPKPKNFLEILGESLGGVEARSISMVAGRHEAVRQALALESLLRREKVLAFAPFFFEIK